jgi:hypothetical protein
MNAQSRAARGRLAGGLVVLLALAWPCVPARAAEPVLPGAPAPLYLQAAALPPAVLCEWSRPECGPCPSPDVPGCGGGQPGGNPSPGPDKGPEAPEPNALVLGLSGAGLAGLVAWRRNRRGPSTRPPRGAV